MCHNRCIGLTKYFLLQTIPPGIPDLVQPSLSKMDLPRLVLDTPKYCNSGIFHEDAKTWWSTFISNFEETYGSIPTVKPNWPLDIINSLEVNATPCVEPTVPGNISTLHKNQMESQPEVFAV